MEQGNPRRAALRKKAMALPLTPGVYLMKDASGQVIYVGKAKALKNRVSQYFGSDTNHGAKVRRMVSLVADFDYILAGSEFEALILECSLIKQYAPKYNILLKDDKGYHYVRIGTPPYGRITVVHQKKDDGARYLGPYISSYGIKQAVDEATKIFGLPTCSRRLMPGKAAGRPCLNRHLGQCCAPCTGRVSEADYAERLAGATELLTQGRTKMAAALKERMEAAAKAMEFETAAVLRDRIAAIRRTEEKQQVILSREPEQDVLAAADGGDTLCVEVFRFRGGALREQEHFLLEGTEALPQARAEFLRRYYSLRDTVPPRISVDGPLEDRELLETWLSEKAGRRVQLSIPQRGEGAQLTELCRRNAAEHLAQHKGLSGHQTAALDELARLLGLSEPPRVIESYDISHTAGTDTVAGMVVFKDGRPHKAGYRRFLLPQCGNDDCAAMAEVLRRRAAEYQAHRGEPDGFGRRPDLILLDGGAEQVAAVRPVLEAAGFTVPLFGMVKDGRHRTRAIAASDGNGPAAEIAIQARRGAYTLVSSIQEEVHRFAIGYHRVRRKKTVIGTTLTKIPGVGPTRAAALLRQFGSVAAVRAASEEELLLVKGMTRPAAQAVRRYFDGEPAAKTPTRPAGPDGASRG